MIVGFISALNLRFKNTNQILVGTPFGGSSFRRELQNWNPASTSELATEITLLRREGSEGSAVEGSRRSNGADSEGKCRRGRPAKHGVQNHGFGEMKI